MECVVQKTLVNLLGLVFYLNNKKEKPLQNNCLNF